MPDTSRQEGGMDPLKKTTIPAAAHLIRIQAPALLQNVQEILKAVRARKIISKRKKLSGKGLLKENQEKVNPLKENLSEERKATDNLLTGRKAIENPLKKSYWGKDTANESLLREKTIKKSP